MALNRSSPSNYKNSHSQIPFLMYSFGATKNYLVKVRDDLVEQSEAFDALVIAVQLRVEFTEIVDGGKDDADPRVALVVQVLRQSVLPWQSKRHGQVFKTKQYATATSPLVSGAKPNTSMH
jgi:hypothetical protein